jgi:hypothetical protein
MQSSLKIDRRLFVWLWLMICCCSVPAIAQTGNLEISRLMQILAQVETRESTFTEKKFLALLTEPLVSRGTLRYRRPNYVERLTTTPRQERFIYENGKITIESGDQQRQFQIKDQPALGALVESIRATLAGDEITLRRHYQLRLTGTRTGWNLEMSPVDPDLVSRIRLIRVSGVQDELRRLEILEASDDRILMIIDAVKR